ncbi:hypothetical protein PO124_29125 [Bacillus licheniformis]|nr:hypothetical protein [Bacillus licheniformis]
MFVLVVLAVFTESHHSILETFRTLIRLLIIIDIFAAPLFLMLNGQASDAGVIPIVLILTAAVTASLCR